MEAFFTQRWSLKDFIKFVLPSVMSIITISLYMTVDIMFVSRFAGPLALAAVNIIMPLFNFCFAVGIMMAAGASAIVGIELGENKIHQGRDHFSLTFCFLMVVMTGLFLSIHGFGVDRTALVLGASKTLLPYCTAYLSAISPGICAVVLQVFFEYFIRLDGKPMWAFFITLASGLTNVGLDYYLIARLGMGIQGAGIASSAGIGVAILIGIYYFGCQSRGLRPVRPTMDMGFLGKAMVNGSSEMATEISSGIKMLVFNLVIIRYAGEAGVAAMAILINLYFLLSAFHIGLGMGVAPVLSFNFGKKNFSKIRHLGHQTLTAALLGSICVFVLAKWHGTTVIALFTEDPFIFTLTTEGMGFFAFVFLVNGSTILASSFFTAMGNGKISAMISLFNSFVFTMGFVIVLPRFLDLTGIWLSIPLAETTGLVLSVFFIFKYRHVYICPRAPVLPAAEFKGHNA